MPIYLNPEHAATRGFQTSGRVKLEIMGRLHDRLVSPFGEVEVKLEFGKQGRRMFVQGSIIGNTVMQCQRCLQDMNQEINHDFRLAFIYSEAEIEGLLPGEEPLLIDDSNNNELQLLDIIEDELELLLPMVVKHAPEQCSGTSVTGIEPAKEIEQIEVNTSKKNPFKVLLDLKKR